ncbi:MAG: type II toxin-antitoxin system RelE/ParE family toxin [Planctomycetota bacterium]
MTQKVIVVSPLAANDAGEIIDYFSFEVEDDELALRFGASLQSTYRSLLDFPDMGSPRWNWASKKLLGVRSWPVTGFRSHFVFYRSTDRGIEILRVLHGSRDIAFQLRVEE